MQPHNHMQLPMFSEPAPSRPIATGDVPKCEQDGGLCGVGGYCKSCPLTGLQRKQRGQKQALDNAGAEWLASAVDLFRVFLGPRKASGAHEFTLETFRAFCALKDLPPPASSKIWGCIPQIAVRAGLIEFTGKYVNASSPKTRAHPVRVWRAL